MRIKFFVRDPRSKVAKASAELPLIIRLRNGQTDIWQNIRISANSAVIVFIDYSNFLPNSLCALGIY